MGNFKSALKIIRSIIIWIILFFMFGWNPIFYIVLFFYILIKYNKKFRDKILRPITINTKTSTVSNITGIVLKCTKCGNVLTINHKFCDNCGEAFDGNNVKVEYDTNESTPVTNTSIVTPYVKPGSFDKMFDLSEDKMVELFIDRELEKAKVDKASKLIPGDILKRKKIFNIIFSLLVFIYISLIFFHFPLLTYIIGIIILIIFFKFTRKYNLMKYLKKQLKSRPSEKVSNIVMSMKTTLVDDTSKNILLPGMIVAVALSLLIFIKPVILYEKTDGGYAVRYYAFGLTNFTTATIPEKHKNENVVSLRGNTFSNMPLLKEVNLPDTIVEIRGQAFKNNRSLTTIKLPTKLTYLGGGAFYNCTSLESIEIPDSVTHIGGEAFYNAKSLKSVKLPNNLEEIRGSTFENCESLESIVIPDSVTRIGGHAFYGNSLLNSVRISENSKLKEIGSSAFRRCNRLYEITLPTDVDINYRAFKESPTNVRTYDMADKNAYKYNTFIYMKLADSVKINEFRSAAIIQDEYITLVSVIPNSGLYEFVFNVNGQVFTLSSSHRYYEVNSNLVIEIEDDYVFRSYSNKVAFYAYYN